MKAHYMSEEQIKEYGRYLQERERESSTREKYLHNVREFYTWLDGRALTKAAACEWKRYVASQGYATSTINCRIAALNSFLEFAGWQGCKVKPLRIQRKVFRDSSRELSRAEYEKLVSTALELGRIRLSLVLETICALGIRVSELKYITVETVLCGRAEISLKGKIRTILIPHKLSMKLKRYAKSQKIASGEIFLTRSGKSLSRKQIWSEMKALCGEAGVDAAKVFPHNLRHLFARCFYRACRDIAKLADVLGHSSIETTRIYLISTGIEHAKTLEGLRLIL